MATSGQTAGTTGLSGCCSSVFDSFLGGRQRHTAHRAGRTFAATLSGQRTIDWLSSLIDPEIATRYPKLAEPVNEQTNPAPVIAWQ